MGNKKHSDSVQLINTTQVVLLFPLITNRSFIVFSFSRIAILPFPLRIPKRDKIVDRVRTMLISSERTVQPNLLHFEFVFLLAPHLSLPFYFKLHNSPSFDGCIFYLSKLLCGCNL